MMCQKKESALLFKDVINLRSTANQAGSVCMIAHMGVPTVEFNLKKLGHRAKSRKGEAR